MFNKVNYIVKAGKHKAKGINFGINWANRNITWTFKIDSSWWYKKDKVKYSGVNKVCGVTFGLFPKIKKYQKRYTRVIKLPFGLCYIKSMHWNSLRLGAQPEFDTYGRVWIYYYYYKNGMLTYNNFFLAAREKYDVTFQYIENDWQINLNNKKHSLYLFNLKPQLGWFLFPYFGGKSILFKDWIVYLNRW